MARLFRSLELLVRALKEDFAEDYGVTQLVLDSTPETEHIFEEAFARDPKTRFLSSQERQELMRLLGERNIEEKKN